MVAATGRNVQHSLHRHAGMNAGDEQSLRATGRSQPRAPLHRSAGMSDRVESLSGQAAKSERALSGSDRNASEAVIAILKQYHLGSLASDVVDFVKKGYDTDTIFLLLQSTDAWKQRFAGNEALKKKGLAPLSPADYLATEQGYQQVIRQYGLPKGFYDSEADMAKLIGGGVSPSELQSRAQSWSDFVSTKDSSTVKALSKYGLGVGDLAAYYMNPNRALPLLQKKTAQVQTAAAAIRQGFGGITKGRVNQLIDAGLTSDQVQQGFGQVAQYGADISNLGDIYGEHYDTNSAINDFLLGKAGAAKKREQLASQERATFSGSSNGSLGSGSNNNSF